MRLYQSPEGQWFGTQADARSHAPKDWREVNVPTSKQELIDWLSLHEVGAIKNGLAPSPVIEPQEKVSAQPRHPQSCSASPNRYDVHDAVLNCDRADLGAALGAIISRLHDVEV